MIFLRQVDDFAIASPKKEHTDSFLEVLDGYLKQKLIFQGILSSFNGLDVQQTTCHTKTFCSSYLTKILKGHNWLTSNTSHAKSPIPNDFKNLKSMCTSKGPNNASDAAKIQQKMGFHYRQIIGELMFAEVTCRTDVLFFAILLSQHNKCPS